MEFKNDPDVQEWDIKIYCDTKEETLKIERALGDEYNYIQILDTATNEPVDWSDYIPSR